jgi:hypothetical protein
MKLALTGALELIGPTMPLTFLVWGLKRIVPVRVDALSITEEAHDPKLNPIQARVQLTLRVLSYTDLPLSNPGYYVYLVNQGVREAMASWGSIGGLRSVFGGGASLF